MRLLHLDKRNQFSEWLWLQLIRECVCEVGWHAACARKWVVFGCVHARTALVVSASRARLSLLERLEPGEPRVSGPACKLVGEAGTF